MILMATRWRKSGTDLEAVAEGQHEQEGEEFGVPPALPHVAERLDGTEEGDDALGVSMRSSASTVSNERSWM